MVALQRILRIVKNNSCSYSSFNLRRKKADKNWTAEEAAFYKAHPEFVEDPNAIQEPAQEMPPQSSPVVYHSGDLPEDIDQRMDMWIRENQKELEVESQYALPELMTKKNVSPSDSYLSPDPVLYQAMLTNSRYKDSFVAKLEAFVGDKQKASLFVDTMLAKTEGLMGDITQRESEMAEEEARARAIEEDKARKGGPDPYAQPICLPDPRLDIKAAKLYLDLKPPERLAVLEGWGHPIPPRNIFNEKYEAMISQATANKLSSPPEGGLDQRMNFFLKYPHHLVPIIKSDPSFEDRLKTESARMGLHGEANEILSQAWGLKHNKSRILNILHNEKAQELYKKLEELISKFDPAISQWLKTDIFNVDVGGSGASYNQGEDEEGDPMSKNLAGLTSKDMGRDPVSDSDMDRSSKMVAAITRSYLQGELDIMQQLASDSVHTMMNENVDKCRGLDQKMVGMIDTDDIKRIRKSQEPFIKRYTF
ncbi:MAG: hypothetical protein ACTSSP_02775, partial [Candidatus Asgardarchaeia archaeon]